jgi:hypothetical protein
MKIRSSLSTAPAPVRLFSVLGSSRLLASAAALASLSACTGPAPIVLDRPFLPNIVITPDGWIVTPNVPRGGTVPDLGGITPLRTSGAFSFEGELAAGTARLSAVVVDVTSEVPPATVGTGSFLVPVEGIDYARTDVPAVAAILPEESEMLVLAAFATELDAAGAEVGTVVWIAVPRADAVTGAVVVLDGESRIAVFGTGPIESETPEVAAVAVTGTLTFGAVDLTVGGRVDAALAADFGRAVFDDVGPTDPPLPPAPAFAAGSYELSLLGGADVHCEGGLAGREGELAALSADAHGIAGGALEVSGTFDALAFSGAAIEATFGAPRVDASWQGDIGAFTVFAEGTGAGALGLEEEGRYLLTSGPDAEALIGVFLVDPADTTGASFCQVGFPAGIVLR